MGHPNVDVDVESLQKSGRRRWSCMDVFVIVSIIFLFAAIAVIAFVIVNIVMKPSDLKEVTVAGDPPSLSYKAQNFAYLQANSSRLNNSTMHLEPFLYGEGTSVGSNFKFDADQKYLMPKKAGTYFIYIDLSLTCTYKCNTGHLRVQVDKLTCQMELPTLANSTVVSKRCWTVSQFDDQKLLAQMTVSKGLENWKLVLSSSGMGIFLID